MSMRILSDQIKTKLESVSGIQVVYDYPWLDFDGYPAATITPSGMDSDYETTTENLRKYVFTVRLFVSLNEIAGDSYKKKVEDGFRLAEELVDDVIDVLDRDETLTGIQTQLPSRYTMIALTPIPSVINYFIEEKIIVAEVKIEAKVSFDISS